VRPRDRDARRPHRRAGTRPSASWARRRRTIRASSWLLFRIPGSKIGCEGGKAGHDQKAGKRRAPGKRRRASRALAQRSRRASAKTSLAAAKKSRAGLKAKARAPSKPAIAAKPKSHDPLDAFVDAAALALGLPIEPQWRPAVKANLQVTLRQAALVTEFPLSDEAEPAPVFGA